MPDSPFVTENFSIDVLLNGKRISIIDRLTSAEVNRSVGRIPTAELVFSIAPDEKTVDPFELVNSDDYDPGAEIEIKAGYDSKNETIFKGVIDSQGFDIQAGEMLEFTLSCADKAVHLTRVRETAFFQNQKDSDILSALIVESGLQAAVDATSTVHQQVVRYEESAWDFMVERATVNGLLLFAEDGKVLARKPNPDDAPLLKIDWGQDGIRHTLRKRARHPSTIFPGTAKTTTKLSKNKTGQKQAIGDVIQHHLHGWLTILGNAAPRLNTPIQLNGFGAKFSENALISGIQHRFGPNEWHTSVEIGMFPEPISNTPDKALKAMIAKNNLQIAFNDGDKTVTFSTPGGNFIDLSDKDQSITIRDQSGNKIEMTKSGISLNSAKDIVFNATGRIDLQSTSGISAKASGGNINLEGLHVQAKADVAFSANGNASAELKSSGNTSVKGAMVMIN